MVEVKKFVSKQDGFKAIINLNLLTTQFKTKSQNPFNEGKNDFSLSFVFAEFQHINLVTLNKIQIEFSVCQLRYFSPNLIKGISDIVTNSDAFEYLEDKKCCKISSASKWIPSFTSKFILRPSKSDFTEKFTTVLSFLIVTLRAVWSIACWKAQFRSSQKPITFSFYHPL